jgi:RNA polymerase sigma-70 factor (ECF subfamily)
VDDHQRYREFAQQLVELQHKLFLYIIALVHRAADADDLLQETNRVVWEKFAEYEPGTNFQAWVYRIAYFEVLTFRKRQGRERIRFSDGLIDQIAQKTAAAADELEPRRKALDQCLAGLSATDRAIIERRYWDDASPAEVARHFGRSEKGIYETLARIRTQLLTCIQRRLAVEDLG